jgi:protein-disulfide isomerase
LPVAAQPFSADQRKAIEGIVRGYILGSPEIIREAAEALQAKEQLSIDDRRERAIAQFADDLISDPLSPVLGNPHGDVTIVEFFDYRCPYCKRMAEVITELIKEDGNIRHVMKELPIFGPESVYASRAALAAISQGKYESLYRLLIGARGALDRDTVMKLARKADVDLKQLARDMESPKIDDALGRTRDLAAALEVAGTPTFIIGREFVPGAVSLEQLRTLVALSRRR